MANPFFSEKLFEEFEERLKAKPVQPADDGLVDYKSLSDGEKKMLQDLQTAFDRMPGAERERLEKKVDQYLNAEISWAEFDGYPAELLFEMAKTGQSFIDFNRLDDALKVFRGLSILDHKNYYYRGMLGAIQQKKKAYIEAITEYSLALELNSSDIPSYTNRAECWMKVGLESEALPDLRRAIALGDERLIATGEMDRWANRARVLQEKALKDMAEKKVKH